MTMQFAFQDSEVLSLADDYFGPRRRRRKKKKEEEKKTTKEKTGPTIPGPKKVLRGTKTIGSTTYDFTCTAELDLETPLDTILTIECVSEYTTVQY